VSLSAPRCSLGGEFQQASSCAATVVQPSEWTSRAKANNPAAKDVSLATCPTVLSSAALYLTQWVAITASTPLAANRTPARESSSRCRVVTPASSKDTPPMATRAHANSSRRRWVATLNVAMTTADNWTSSHRRWDDSGIPSGYDERLQASSGRVQRTAELTGLVAAWLTAKKP